MDDDESEESVGELLKTMQFAQRLPGLPRQLYDSVRSMAPIGGYGTFEMSLRRIVLSDA